MVSECNKKACVISFIAALAFVFGYDWFVHGQLLKADYEATASLWRTPEEMEQFWPWCIAYHIALAAILTCLFKKFRKGVLACCPDSANTCCPIKTGGLCFGVKIGLLLGIVHASSYIWLPIPGSLAIKWLLTGLGQGIGVGVILGIISGKFSGGSCGTASCSAPSCSTEKKDNA